MLMRVYLLSLARMIDSSKRAPETNCCKAAVHFATCESDLPNARALERQLDRGKFDFEWLIMFSLRSAFIFALTFS
jgi:hypothetical protein